MQVPNINESGYYAGVVALKSYADKFHSDINVEIIDPIIDYFYLNPPDKESDFFQMFNTYARQGEWEELLKFQEIHDMCEGFIFKYIDNSSLTRWSVNDIFPAIVIKISNTHTPSISCTIWCS